MAAWDSADLLARLRQHVQLPSTDASLTDAQGYNLLTEGQSHWHSVIATQAPWWLMGAPTQLSTADSGVTYTFGAGVYPLAVEVYETLDGRLMRPGAYWDRTADYIWEGDNIRFPGNVAWTPAPYARWVSTPTAIDGSTAPVLHPAHARTLIVYRAAVLWATPRGGQGPFEQLERRAWVGDVAMGDLGILGLLKTQNPFLGTGSFVSNWSDSLLSSVSTGAGYRAI